MAVEAFIGDGCGGGQRAAVSSRGQLIVGPLDFSLAYSVEATATATAYNFVGPKAAKRFVITDILLYADKNIGVNDASVQIYEADADDETTIVTTLLDIEMVKQTSRDITGLNLLVTEGKWVNLKTDDATIFGTLMGYYVNA